MSCFFVVFLTERLRVRLRVFHLISPFFLFAQPAACFRYIFLGQARMFFCNPLRIHKICMVLFCAATCSLEQVQPCRNRTCIRMSSSLFAQAPLTSHTSHLREFSFSLPQSLWHCTTYCNTFFSCRLLRKTLFRTTHKHMYSLRTLASLDPASAAGAIIGVA